MSDQQIQIPATLTKTHQIRLFIADFEAEVKHQSFDPQQVGADILLKGEGIPSHKKVMSILQRHSERSKGKDRNLDKFGPNLRFGVNGSSTKEAVIGYQVIELVQIQDDRSKFNHESRGTHSVKALSKTVFIFGTMVNPPKIKALIDWVKQQRDNPHPDHDEFARRGVSAMTPYGAEQAFKRSRFCRALKIGPATFVPWNPKKMEFHPHR